MASQAALQYRDRSQDTEPQERPPCPFSLIFIEPIRNQRADANAKRNPSSYTLDSHGCGARTILPVADRIIGFDESLTTPHLRLVTLERTTDPGFTLMHDRKTNQLH
jgi:hypothetical protein